MGSHLSLAIAAEHGDRVGNLILGGVGARMLSDDPSPFIGTMTRGEAMRADDPSTITDPTLKGFRQFAENQGEDRFALAACGEGRGERLNHDNLLRLRMPVLVVAGSRDEIAGDPQTLADAIPGAGLTIVPGCGHMVHWFVPDMIAKKVAVGGVKIRAPERTAELAESIQG